MRVFTTLLLLLHITFSHGFYRLGTVNVGGVSGTVYLIDSNTLFLFEFSASESVNIVGTDGAGGSPVTASTSGALSNANMMIDANANLLNSAYITIRIASNNNLIVTFPVQNNIYIPCSAEYLGRFSRNGGSTSHALDGHVFLDRAARRFFVAGLDLDGTAPAAYFWLDTSATPTAAGKRAGYNGVYNVRVNNVNNIDANVTIPPRYTATIFRSLSVWCESAAVSFGHVDIPSVAADSFACSTTYGPVTLGLSPPKHQVSAKVYVLGPTTIGFEDGNYDGTAPATWYWSGPTSSNLANGFIVPDQTGSLAVLGALSNADVVLTLPAGYDVCNTDFISIYCVRASVSFGNVGFSSQFGCSNCPTRCRTISSASTAFQCRDLSTTVKTRVEYRFNPISQIMTFRLLTCGQEADQYVAFGISASSNGVAMSPNGDAVVCRYTSAGAAECIDYGLTRRSQCTLISGTGEGACPDSVLTSGVNSYVNTEYERVGTRTIFTTMRAVNTGDPNDRVFTPGTPQYIIWARGGTFDAGSNRRWVLRHASTDRTTVSNPIQIDFSADSQCATEFVCDAPPSPEPVIPWNVPPLCIDSSNNVIEAAIGNTGGKQGYKAITGDEGWGIAWYLNGSLIPEVYVLRDTTVRFYINGGDNSSEGATYHPFYITNSDKGGILTVIGAGDAITETVYAGLVVNGNNVSDLTVGKYCNWDESAGMSGDDFTTFSAYRDTLTLSCGNNLVPNGMIEWTPDANTPNLVYYQCASHRLLGWKIRVVDDLAACRGSATLVLPFTLLLFISVMLTFYYAI